MNYEMQGEIWASIDKDAERPFSWVFVGNKEKRPKARWLRTFIVGAETNLVTNRK